MSRRKIKPIPREEIESRYLEKMMTMKEIADEFNVSVGYIFDRMKEYGIPSRKTHSEITRKRFSDAQKGRRRSNKPPYIPSKHLHHWTKEEDDFLRKNYNLTINEELCKKLNLSWPSVYKRARRLGLYKSEEAKFRQKSFARSGEKSASWKGGRKITNQGYVVVLNKCHHRASNGYVMEHILVFEQHTGIKVPLGCDVHHINGNKQDNRIENLCLMTHRAHTILHNKEMKI